MGFEPTTPTLARLCSTPELHPHPCRGTPVRGAYGACRRRLQHPRALNCRPLCWSIPTRGSELMFARAHAKRYGAGASARPKDE